MAIFAIILYMNPFGYNLKSRCRNKTKRISNRPTSRNSDVFTYNEHSEVVFSRGVAEDAKYSYDEIGNLVAFFYKDIEANKWKQFTPRTATFPHNVKKGPDAKLLKVNRIK